MTKDVDKTMANSSMNVSNMDKKTATASIETVVSAEDIKPVEVKIDPATQALIDAAVAEALAKAQTKDVISPQVVAQPAGQRVPQVNMGMASPQNFTNNPGYKKVSRGFPVQPGQTWQDLTPEQRKQWFAEHENRWKSRFGIQNQGLQGSVNWTRG